MYLEERRNGESNREYALRILKANIIQMILEPGCPIGEQKIAKELGMSRTPVREALVELMKTRIVEILPQKGTYVSYLDYDLVEEARFMRMTLELALLDELAEKMTVRFAVEALPHCLHTVLDETQRTLDDLSWVVCHQANSRIIDHCVKALRADPAKFYKNMDRHGNTSAASIPVALNELAESGQLKPGQLLACIGFGGGLTWGGAIFQYKECV